MITNLRTTAEGNITYDRNGMMCLASLPLLIVRDAWNRGMNLEDLADGFGEGLGTMGDWSAIRDSSRSAQDAMLERALNFMKIGG